MPGADRLWQQNHTGVFTSEDGAGRWKRVSQPEVVDAAGTSANVASPSPATAGKIGMRTRAVAVDYEYVVVFGAR